MNTVSVYRARLIFSSTTTGCIWLCLSSYSWKQFPLFLVWQTPYVIACWQYTNITNIKMHYSVQKLQNHKQITNYYHKLCIHIT